MELYGEEGEVVMWMEFDGTNSSKTSWFTASRLLSSSFSDNPAQKAPVFQMISEQYASFYAVLYFRSMVQTYK